MRRTVTLFLLLLATTHCVLSVFFVNLSYFDLHRYGIGLEPLPFQRRLLLVPFVHWAESSHLLAAIALRYTRYLNQYEPLSGAKLGCMLLGVIAVNALGLFSLRYARKQGLCCDWLPWALLIVILYISYAARFEQALWYPYDLPHLALFGAATLCLLADEPWLFLCFLSVDVFTRETSLYLLFVAFVVRWSSARWRMASVASLALWIASYLLGEHLYPHNVWQLNAVPWYRMAAPWHWPQLFSIVGFLWIPVLLARRALSPLQRKTLYLASLCMVATFFFATWNETRAWLEWSTLFAALAAIELEAALASPQQIQLL
jgi:uncharacterized SAM-binding protein YcdF (DUF218 family)